MSNDLFDFSRTHARNSDPDTSHAAATKAPTLATVHRAMILRILRRYGGMTAAEIASRTPLDTHQINRRTGELIQEGVVVDTGQRRLGPTMRQMRVLALSTHAQANTTSDEEKTS